MPPAKWEKGERDAALKAGPPRLVDERSGWAISILGVFATRKVFVKSGPPPVPQAGGGGRQRVGRRFDIRGPETFLRQPDVWQAQRARWHLRATAKRICGLSEVL